MKNERRTGIVHPAFHPESSGCRSLSCVAELASATLALRAAGQVVRHVAAVARAAGAEGAGVRCRTAAGARERSPLVADLRECQGGDQRDQLELESNGLHWTALLECADGKVTGAGPGEPDSGHIGGERV